MKHLKKLLYLLLFIVLVCASPGSAWAAEKQMQVELDKDYSSCMFKLVFENPGEYQATLTDINGNQYDFARIDDTTMTCTLEKVKAGTYITHIANEAVDDIGKVTLSVTTNNVSTTDIVNNNIMVGKDISGLKMYFKDDTFIAKWTDETCGAVDVKVVNLDTAETIKSEKVTDKDFECPIADYVKRISVSIVPSSSSNITGAELSYTFDINNYPDATVTVPDFQKTNQNEISVNVVLGGNYGVYVEDNGECVLTTDLMLKGTYDIKVPLEADGKNDIMFYIVDPDGNMRSTHFTLNKDTVAPSLSLSEEYDGMQVNEQSIMISGTVANFNTFKVNESDVQVTTDGFFEHECTLHWGENKIHIVAADDAGNETSYDITINAVEPQQKIDWKIVVVLIATCAVIVYSFIKKYLKKRNTAQNSNAEFEESELYDDADEIEEDADRVEEDQPGEDDIKSEDLQSSEGKEQKHEHKHFHLPLFKKKTDIKLEHEPIENEISIDEDCLEDYEDYDEESEDVDEPDDKKESDDMEEPDDMDDMDDEDDELLDMHSVSGKEDGLETDNADDTDNTGKIEGVSVVDKEEPKEKRDTPTLEYPENKPDYKEHGEENSKDKEIKAPISTERKIPEVTVCKELSKSNESEYEPSAELNTESNSAEMASDETSNLPISNENANIDTSESPEVTHSIHEGQTVINIITDGETMKRIHKKKKKHFWGDVLYLAVVAALIYCLFHFVFLNGFISSGSMEPTMMEGDCAISNRLAYVKRTPKCGDIIFFEKDGELLSKRVIGIEGDTVSFSDGQVLINGQVLDESEYIPEDVSTICETTFEVPEGCVFVLGDNREDSFDSRYWDNPYVSISDIKAKYMFLIPLHGVYE